MLSENTVLRTPSLVSLNRHWAKHNQPDVVTDIKTPDVSHRWEEIKKKNIPDFHSKDCFHGWEATDATFPWASPEISVGSEPLLAFLLQFACPIRKQLKTHGELEENSSI